MDIKKAILEAKKNIINANKRIDHVRFNMDTVEKELDTLSTLEIQLLDNISCVKKKKTVALAKEYTKIQQDLRKTRKRLEMLRADREAYRAAYLRSLDNLERCKEAYHVLLTQKKGTNVIHVDFGSPRGS